MKFFGIIPARFESSRFPGKPLAMINGKPMIQRVWEQASLCGILSGLVVATDDERIKTCVEQFNGRVIMTSGDHRTGTERCNEALSYMKDADPGDVVINIQGDEPFIHPLQIEQLAGCFSCNDILIGTLYRKITSAKELHDPNVVKVIFDNDHKAIYFSRQALPYLRGKDPEIWPENGKYFKHIGLYAYKTAVLKKLIALPESVHERAESLEQLRWIDHGYSIHVRETEFESVAIDTPADLLKITNITGNTD